MSKGLKLVKLPPYAAIHKFGTPTSAPSSSALLRFGRPGWEISQPGDSAQGWAIVGDGEGRRLAVETLLSRHRIHPPSPPPGPFPFVTALLPSQSTEYSTSKPIRHLAFARPPPSGEFTDFTARYGALQEEDKLSFRETLSALYPTPSTEDIEAVAGKMRIKHLLDLPSVSLSSGQTRRARIASALLSRPVLLILEDPMAGLDVQSRKEVSRVLGEVNSGGEIRLILVLRGKGESMPEWITNVVEVKDGNVWVGSNEEWRTIQSSELGQLEVVEEKFEAKEARTSLPVVELSDVSVSYGEGTRPVLKNISWTIRPGEKWHLQGANGSGKTTLLSIILGHHPRSWSLPSESLKLFSKPRRSTPTPSLRKLIGHTSPEIYAAFPRGMGLSALDAIGSGFEGVFSKRNLDLGQKQRVLDLLDFFRPLLGSARTGSQGLSNTSIVDLAKRQFSHFPPPHQALLLFLRAIVAKPPLLILDEPAQGMDEIIWTRCRELLEKEWEESRKTGHEQAVIVVSHYEDEVPWAKNQGQILELIEGVAKVK